MQVLDLGKHTPHVVQVGVSPVDTVTAAVAADGGAVDVMAQGVNGGVTFTIEPGEAARLTGPSGQGGGTVFLTADRLSTVTLSGGQYGGGPEETYFGGPQPFGGEPGE